MMLLDTLQLVGTVALSYLCGVFTVVVIVLYAAHRYSKLLPIFQEKPKVQYQRCQLGGLLHQNLHNARGDSIAGNKESCGFVNALLAFVFREWRDTNQLQKWVLKKINIEFLEFMETKTASRLLQGLKIHDVNLGDNFPVFHSATIKEPFSFTDNELPECVSLELEMEYQGGFYLAIDVDLVFGKNAFLGVKIAYLKGKIRLQFCRTPCSHWSISFVEEPEIKFQVETSFETRQLPQLTSLIVNQIRRTIRRKHTLPHYKMRYNPFLSFQHSEPSPFDGFIADIPVKPAVMDVCIAACTRLLVSSRGEKEKYAESSGLVIFATISVNTESCVGKPLLPATTVATKPESSASGSSTSQHGNSVATTQTPTTPVSKNQNSTFDSFQKSILGIRKDITEMIPKTQQKKSQAVEAKKTERNQASQATKATGTSDLSPNINESPVKERKDSISSNSSTSSGPSYVMVALNFGATLREEMKDGSKVVIVDNITEHNVHGQSGMRDGDAVIELNGVKIISLSQAIATIEKIRARNESFKFKVRRSKSADADSISLNENIEPLPDAEISTGSAETESDHSDVDIEDYKDFVNISLQVAEFHRMDVDGTRRSASVSERDCKEKTTTRLQVEADSRQHSSSVSNDGSPETPYMTLVSSPTPSTSMTSLKESSSSSSSSISKVSDENPTAPTKKEFPKKATKTLSLKKNVRSRSESPPFFRKNNTFPKSSSTPIKPRVKNSTSSKSSGTSNKETSNSLPRQVNKTSPTVKDVGKSASLSDLSDLPPPLPGTSRSTDKLSFYRVDDDTDTQLFKSSMVNSNQLEYSWKHETFSFDIKERHRYLNVRFWSQSTGKNLLKNKPAQIVGCVAIPLCELEVHCRGVTSQRVTRRYPLCCPNELPHDHKWFLNDAVSHRSSFREQYCYGDATFNISLHSHPSNKNNSSNLAGVSGASLSESDSNSEINKEILNRITKKTGFDYLLSPAPAKGKKLLVSRQTQTLLREAPSTSTDELDALPESGETDLPESVVPDEIEETVKEKLSLSKLFRGLIQGNKGHADAKFGTNADISTENELLEPDTAKNTSAEGLSALHQFEPVKFSATTKCDHCLKKLWTKSGLRCKNCSAVCHKRCMEKLQNKESCPGCEEDALTETSQKGREEESDSLDNCPNAIPAVAVNFRNKMRGMSTPHADSSHSTMQKKTKHKNAEDLLAVNAKEMGRDLHRDLPLQERKTMLKNQMQKVEQELHCEIEHKEDLLQEQGLLSSTTIEWKRLERKVSKSDERLQALALLLLHYRSGLEDCEFEISEAGEQVVHCEILVVNDNYHQGCQVMRVGGFIRCSELQSLNVRSANLGEEEVCS